MRNLLYLLHQYGLMLKQKHSQITELTIVTEDSEIVDTIKEFKESDIGLFIVEPEIVRNGKLNQSQEVINMQFILLRKIADRVPNLQKVALKDEILNLAFDIDNTMLGHSEDYDDFTYNFSATDPTLPDTNIICQLMPFLDIASIQKIPISNMKVYIGWTINFKLNINQ